jgi:hypothetical protein
MPPLVISRDNITIGGKIIETSKTIGLTPKVEAIPVLMTEERMYPPLRNVSSINHSITGQAYGNGLYVTSFSSAYGNNQPFKCFNTSDTIGGHWAGTRYTTSNGGIFLDTLTDHIVSGYNGDWLKIKFPVAINLTRYTFKERQNLAQRAPRDFKIYGSNDEINWIELTHETNAVYVSGLFNTSIITSGTYNSFGLVVNKIIDGGSLNNEALNFDEWFIYGMEQIDPNNYSLVPFHEPINDDYKYIPFVNTGANQTPYNIHFSENTECDILIVGGGGAGGFFGGGGGSGSVLFRSQIVLNGVISIQVGRGGVGSHLNTANGENGLQSSIIIDGITYIADGGGGGGTRQSNNIGRHGNNGGSGGGASHSNSGQFNGGTSTKATYIYTGWETNGFNGGNGKPNTSGGAPDHASGGGGGAGGLGQNWDSTGGGDGGLGVEYISVFGTSVGHNGYFGGGGGGNTWVGGTGDVGYANGGNGLFGGGGNGGYDLISGTSNGNDISAQDAINGTGGGGGGSKIDGGTNEDKDGGDGGSGIVIIRYKIIKIPFESQWTYNPSNLNVYHLGNVGIGTINPTTDLDVLGSVVVNGSISTNSYIASTKTFKIEHPLNINKWLYHGCIEAPRFDNIYRGKKMLINGTCEVDIDSECNTTGGMTAGTFMALNNNFSLHLQNKNSFDGVKGEVIDGKIIISCENIAEEIEVEWLVIGERHDEGIIRNKLTNNEGMLICEHEY